MMNLIYFLILGGAACASMSACSKLPAPRVTNTTYQAKQTDSLIQLKNYVLCKNCIKYNQTKTGE